MTTDSRRKLRLWEIQQVRSARRKATGAESPFYTSRWSLSPRLHRVWAPIIVGANPSIATP